MRRLVGALTLACGAIVLAAAPASAHAQLERTEPEAGAVLDAAPNEVVVFFSEGVPAGDDALRVFDGRGERVDDGEVRRVDGDDTLAVGLREIGDGGYVIAYRVVSADSHPITGAFTFRVGSQATAVDADTVAGLVAEAEPGPGVGGTYAIVRFLAFAGLVVLVGGAAFLALVWREGAGLTAVRRILWGAWAVLALATVAGLGLQGAEENGLDLLDAARPSVVVDVLDTRFGVVWLLRLGLLATAVPLLLALRRSAAWQAPAALVGLGLVLTPALSGHASSGDLVPLAIVADTVHVAAVSLWLGGLVVLLGFVLRRRQAEVLRAVVPRFSALALAAVATIVVTGSFQGWRQLRSLDALTDTSYGRLLLIKTAAFAGLVALGALNRAVVRQRLWAPLAVAGYPAGPGAALADPDGVTVERLRRAVGIEVAVAVGVLAVTALLVDADPARSETTERSEPFAAVVEAEGADVEISLTPGSTGANDVELSVITASGEDPLEVTATMSLPDRDIGAIDLELAATDQGRWTGTVDLPIAGDWLLEVRLLLTEIESDTASLTVPIN